MVVVPTSSHHENLKTGVVSNKNEENNKIEHTHTRRCKLHRLGQPFVIRHLVIRHHRPSSLPITTTHRGC